MAHCPQCGTGVEDGVSECPSCGLVLALVKTPAKPGMASRTMLGGITDATPVPSAGAPESKAAKTIMGMPHELLPKGVGSTQRMSAQDAQAAAPANRTMVGVAPPEDGGLTRTSFLGTGAKAQETPVVHSPKAGGTLLGVATPGIAPLNPGVEKPAPVSIQEAAPTEGSSRELGATLGAMPPAARAQPHKLAKRMRHARVGAGGKATAPEAIAKPSKRPWIVVGAGAVLAIGALLFALLYDSAPPLSARVTVDQEGHELIEISCPACPNGTKVSLAGGSATIEDRVAEVPIRSALSLGDNQLRVDVDRPGNGRDETIGLEVHVAYRIRPDLATLQGDSPSIVVEVEAVEGTEVELDGKEIPLVKGHAIHTIDVTSAVTGPSPTLAKLSRDVPYVVRPPDGEEERGTVSVSVSILPLVIDAPGRRVVVADKTFVLAGRTLPKAEVLVAGKEIPVKPDGSFAQVMNVSSVGATQIEVRAKMPERAPRLYRIDVNRVDNLASAAAQFSKHDPLNFAALDANVEAAVGKRVVLSGEVVEARRQNHQTIMLLSVPPTAGCTKKASDCTVRLVHGVENPAQKGDAITAYGRVAGEFAVEGRPPIPEIDVEFTLEANP